MEENTAKDSLRILDKDALHLAKLTAVGVPGAGIHLVASRVELVVMSLEAESATAQHHKMAERTVMEISRTPRIAPLPTAQLTEAGAAGRIGLDRTFPVERDQSAEFVCATFHLHSMAENHALKTALK